MSTQLPVLEFALNTTGLSPDAITQAERTVQLEYEAFVAGFLATGEGYNGERVGHCYNERPLVRAAAKAFKRWKRDR